MIPNILPPIDTDGQCGNGNANFCGNVRLPFAVMRNYVIGMTIALVGVCVMMYWPR